MSDFLAMGGYGAYVWSAYGFAVVVLAGVFWQSGRFARKRAAEVEALRRHGPAAAGAAPRAAAARRLTEPAAPPAAGPWPGAAR